MTPLTLEEQLILATVFYENPRVQSIKNYAIPLRNTFRGFLEVKDEALDPAIRSCFEKSLIAPVTEQFLAEAKAYLKAANATDPVQGFPEIGQVDLTLAGAEWWKEYRSPQMYREVQVPNYREESPDQPAECDWSLYYPNRDHAYYALGWLAGNLLPVSDARITSLHGPETLGPWSAYWWDIYPVGYRIEVTASEGWSIFIPFPKSFPVAFDTKASSE